MTPWKEGFLAGAAIVFVIMTLVVIPPISAQQNLVGHRRAMAEAFERGYAVQCLGVTGYHWECKE